MKYITKGTVTAVLTIAAMAATVAGKDALAKYLNDPTTADLIMAAIGSIGALVAGLLPGVKQ